MSKTGQQCKLGNKETRELANALKSSYPVDEHTILSKIEAYQTIYDKDPMYVPSIQEMKAFLDLQALGVELLVPPSKVRDLEKQIKEGKAVALEINNNRYIGTVDGTIIKILPNKTMRYVNPSDDEDDNIKLQEAFDVYFSNTNKNTSTEKVEWGVTSDNSFEVSTAANKSEVIGDSRFSALNATFKPGTIIDGVDVGGMTIENVYQSVIKKSGKGKAPSKTSRLNLNPTSTSEEKRLKFLEEVKAKYGNPLTYSTDEGIITVNFENGSLRVIPFAGSVEDLSGEFLGNKDINYFIGALKAAEDLAGGYEDFSYREGYLPLWQEWARQNPELMQELREKSRGKVLTDRFAYRTLVSQARALADILNSTEKEDNTQDTTDETSIESANNNDKLTINEDSAISYLSRTKQNAEWSDVTIALGEDLTTAGELQTAKFAGAEVEEVEKTNSRGEKYTTVSKVIDPKKGKYVGIDLNKTTSAETIAEEIYKQIIERGLPKDNIKLNIAGNGIYTLKSDQSVYDSLMEEVLKKLQEKGITIEEVRSGGQTGIDEAGVKAALSLGIKASILAPKGYRFRDKNNEDIKNKEAFIKRFNPNYSESQDRPAPTVTGIFSTLDKEVYWDRKDAEEDKDSLYIFTDNTDRDSGKLVIDPNSKYAKKYGKNKHYPTVTSAVLRGLDNSMPISTQRWYHKDAKGETGRWTDKDAKEFEETIKNEIDDIIEEWNSGKYKRVVIPSKGFFESTISEFTKERVPKLYEILTNQLTRLENAIGKDNIEPFTKDKNTKTKKGKSKVLFEADEVTEGKKKAKEFTIISSSQLGANSAWRIAAENYGVESIHMSNTMTYDDLSAEERAALELPYHNAMVALKRSEIKLTNASANKTTIRIGKLGRLLYKQIKESDGVFLISELVDPGANAHSFVQGKQGRENTSKFTVAGDSLSSISIYHAIQMNKPIHVFDQFRDSWMTYDYSTNKWVEEKTPKLTKKAFTFGREGSKGKKGFDESLGEENWKAIRDVMFETFGWVAMNYIDKSSKVLTDAEMNEVWRETKRQSENYVPDKSGVYIDNTNATARLIQSMSSNERYHRAQFLAREFSAIIDDFIEEDKKSIDERVLNARIKVDGDSIESEEEREAWEKILEKEEAYKKILNSGDETRIRRAVIKRHGLINTDSITNKSFGILDELKGRVLDRIANSEDDEKRSKWQLVYDNFDALMVDAFDIIQYIENFRLIPYVNKNSNNINTNITDSTEDITNTENGLVDDEGNNMEGNAGWSFKVRFVDPRTTLSHITKRALNTIIDRDDDGKTKVDDLGSTVYVNGEYAHAILISELSDMIDSDDFCVQSGRDKKGNIIFKFPALEKLSVKYPWIKGLLNKLRKDNQLAGAFFHDFNKAFIKYYSCESSGKPMPLNHEMASSAAYTAVKNNYEIGNTLTKLSIYSEGGLEKDNAKELLQRLETLNKSINNKLNDRAYIDSLKEDTFSNKKEIEEQEKKYISSLGDIAKELTFILRSMGFNSDEIYVRNNLYLLLSKDTTTGSIPYTKLYDNIKSILSAISSGEEARGKKKVKTDDNYLIDFQGQLKNICKLIGQITESDNIQSFRDGNKTRYSYSAVNYAINMVKKLKSDSRRAKYIEDEFQYDEWFYYDGEFQNYWLDILSREDSTAKYLRDNLDVCEVISMQSDKGPIKYDDWDEYQTCRVMLGQFFSRASGDDGVQLANYNFPLFSDSPTSMYITMQRFVSNAKQGSFKEQMLPLFIKLVKQEMRRIKLVNNRKSARNDDSTIDKTRLEEIQNYDKQGGEFLFFPELNTIAVPSLGVTFKEAALMYLDKGDMKSLNNLIAETLAGKINPTTNQREGGLMDQLFMDFMKQFSHLDNDELAKMLHDLGGITYLGNTAIKKYAEENNVSIGEAEIEIERQNYQNSIEALKNYFWNSVFATSQIIQLTTTDLAYYKNATDFYKRFKEVYAAGNRLNVSTKYGRRVENTVYISDHIVTTSKYTLAKKSLETAVKEGRLNENEKNIILDKLKDINAADAQAFRNPYAFRAVLDMMGAWSDEMDEAFNKILKNEYDSRDFAIIMQTIKPFMFTNVPTDNGLGGRNRVPHQNKNSEYLSLAFYDIVAMSGAFGDSARTLKDSAFLAGIGRFFEEHQEIDVIQFESAVKAGGQGIIDITYNGDIVNEYLEENDGKYYNRAKDIVTKDAINRGKDPDEEFNKLSNMKKLKIALDDMLDKGDITQEEYNDIMEDTEPSPRELCDYLNKAVVDPETGEFEISNKEFGGKFNHQIVHQLSYADYMIAQPNPPHFMDQFDAVSGSQFRNLILANLPKDFKTTITINRNGVPTKVELNLEQIRNLYRGAIVNNLLDSFEDLQNNTFSNIHSLQKRLLSAVQNNPKYGTDIVDALQIITVEDPLNPGNTIEVFNLPLDLPTISNQIQELILSVFKNHVTRQTIFGGSFVQVANVGLTKKLSVVRNEDGTIKYAECMLPAWSKEFFKYYMTKDKNGNYYLDINKVPDDLKKMVGYRIPTENKYSMLPLKVVGFLPAEQGGAIMLPADITLIAGSDFDVDKMFLRIPVFEKIMEGKKAVGLKKVEYDLDDDILNSNKAWKSTSSGRMTKQQRDNMMIDIEFAILTSKEGSEQVYKPGNFELVKKWGKASRIINDTDLRQRFIKKYGDLIGINTDDEAELERADNASTIIDLLHHKSIIDDKEVDTISLEDIIKFVESNRMNVLLPQTYIYAHTQNMVGASLVGVYANGASLHSKMQETYLSISDDLAFDIIGVDGKKRRVQSLHDQTTIIDNQVVYIQELIAQLQAASVDNGKDPTLADLYQSMYTANTALFMARAGIDIEEISYFFGVIKALKEHEIDIDPKIYVNLRSHARKLLDSEELPREIDVKDIINTNIYIQKYPDIINAITSSRSSDKEEGLNPKLAEALNQLMDKYNLGSKEIKNIIISVCNAYSTIYNIIYLKGKLKPANDIMQCDSTNHALSVSIPSAILQNFEVERVRSLINSRYYPFVGDEDSSIEDEFIINKVITLNQPREEKEELLMSRRLPHIQAFYSLGIELPLNMMKDYFIQGNKELQENLLNLLRDAPESQFGKLSDGSYGGTRLVNAYFREYMQYILSDTEEFGDSDNGSYDVKRMYYLDSFTKKFIKLKKENHPAIIYNSTLSRITVTRPSGENANSTPQLILPRNGQLTPRMKASIRRDLDILLYSKDPEIVELGIDLFKYSYYNNGFNYGPNSFGSYFDSVYWNSVPRVLELLRTFKHNNTSIQKSLNNFTEMFIANHSDDLSDNLLYTYSELNPKGVNEDGTITVPYKYVYSRLSGGARKYIRFAADGVDDSFIPYKILKSDKENKTVTYKRVPVFDEPKPVYNAKSTAKKMEAMYFNDRKAKISAKLKSAKETDNTDEKKPTNNSSTANLNTTETDNNVGIDEAAEQSDLAIQSGFNNTNSSSEESSDNKNKAKDPKVSKDMEKIIANRNNNEELSVDENSLEDMLSKRNSGIDPEFEKMVDNNGDISEKYVEAREPYNSGTTNALDSRLDKIKEESNKAYDAVNKCKR